MKIKAPKYIQISIKRMIYHRKIVENNTAIVNRWFEANNVKKSTCLMDLIEENKKEVALKGQMSIFGFIEEK